MERKMHKMCIKSDQWKWKVVMIIINKGGKGNNWSHTIDLLSGRLAFINIITKYFLSLCSIDSLNIIMGYSFICVSNANRSFWVM